MPKSEAEHLIDLAKVIMRNPGELIEGVSGPYLTSTQGQSDAAFALKFVRTPIVLRFRALVEEWGRKRIVDEMLNV